MRYAHGTFHLVGVPRPGFELRTANSSVLGSHGFSNGGTATGTQEFAGAQLPSLSPRGGDVLDLGRTGHSSRLCHVPTPVRAPPGP
eukprot:1203812-Prymnesium_polylepis.1